MQYLRRVADRVVADGLQVQGAVLIEGPRACGKTETAKQFAQSAVQVDTDQSVRTLLDADPQALLSGATPRLFDEWQAVPELWNHVRHAVDDRKKKGQFILTGSSTPADDAKRHSGAGRFRRVQMTTMSLFESGESDGRNSLAELHAGGSPASGSVEFSLDALIGRISSGGFPAMHDSPALERRDYLDDYLTHLSSVDIRAVDGRRMDERRVAALVRSIARNVATEVDMSTLARDTSVNGEPLARKTVAQYLDALVRSFAVYEQSAWGTHLRSRARQRTTPKLHLADPAMAAAALGASADQLKSDLNYLGFLFESLVIHDLRVYASPMRGEITHYRDSNGLEVDAIVSTRSGWGAIEVKLGQSAIEEAAANLVKFAGQVDTQRMGEPDYLMVIVPSGYSYRREDGVDVVPVTTLGP